MNDEGGFRWQANVTVGIAKTMGYGRLYLRREKNHKTKEYL
jgi:hypothetical protein